MTVEELMSWVGSFASEEATQLIQESGLRGVQAILPIVTELAGLLDEFEVIIHRPNSRIPDGLRQRRVRNSLRELIEYLEQVENLARRIVI
jgi:hypothetical protein